jgi:hypothetical protein
MSTVGAAHAGTTFGANGQIGRATRISFRARSVVETRQAATKAVAKAVPANAPPREGAAPADAMVAKSGVAGAERYAVVVPSTICL